MTIRPHALGEASTFVRSVPLYDEHIRGGLALLGQGLGDAQAICRQGLRLSVWNGCISLIVSRGDDEALRYFRQALAFGLLALGAPGSMKGLRAYDVLMEVSSEGSRILHEHERRSSREPRILPVGDYSGVLQMAVCFGDQGAMDEVARYPEERYRNPNVIAGEDYYGYLRAWKRLILGDPSDAKVSMRGAIDENRNPRVAPDMEAFVHVVDGNQARFEECLEKRLHGHKKQYQKKPGDPEGLICFPGLMLCRQALDRGLRVEEWPYLPVRLLPNYQPAGH